MAQSVTQLIRVLNKLKVNNITEDRELMNISYDKLEVFENITEYEKLIILQYGAALKNHRVTSFLQNSKNKAKGGNKDGI